MVHSLYIADCPADFLHRKIGQFIRKALLILIYF